MTRFTAALGRLLLLQASWTYERLQGIGTGFASLPLLDDLKSDPARYHDAVARSTEYFNAHPYLAGIAVGAAARAEHEGVPGVTIQRLKAALSGPLGALGDQLFWIGVVPAVAGTLLASIALGGGWLPVATGLGLYLVVRVAVTAWGLRTGLAAGLDVAATLKVSGLQGQVRRVGYLAGLAVGMALPLLVAWYAGAGTERVPLVAGLGGALGLASALIRRRLPTARRMTLAALALVTLGYWSLG